MFTAFLSVCLLTPTTIRLPQAHSNSDNNGLDLPHSFSPSTTTEEEIELGEKREKGNEWRGRRKGT